MFEKGKIAVIEKKSFVIPPVFKLLSSTGNIDERDMFNTFNMGIGMTLCVDKNDADKAMEILNSAGEKAYIIGEIADGDEGVIIKN